MWLALACTETPKHHPHEDPTTPTVPTTPPTEGVEACNGVDDDGDGQVDEAFPDFDGDAVADCVDDACDPVTTPVAVDPRTCAGWWEVTQRPALDLGVSANLGLVTGSLMDDDGDGQVTDADHVAIVVTGQNKLAAYDAVTGALELEVTGNWWNNAAALIDIDGGGPEILALRQQNDGLFVVEAIDRTGATVWETAPFLPPGNSIYGEMCMLTAADLNGDGALEVVCDATVFDAATGALAFTYDAPDHPSGTLVVTDLEQDGLAEILFGGVVVREGAVAWDAGLGPEPGYNFPATAQLDADPEAEVVWVDGGDVRVFEHDGTPSAVWSIGGRGGGPPCVADFDGDGAFEVAVVFKTETAVFEADGSVAWTFPDGGPNLGCSAFDLDGDGAAELMATLPGQLVILDGATGEPVYTDPTLLEPGYWTHPLPVDLDRDGHTEIVALSKPLLSELRVYAQADGRWAGSGPEWNTVDWTSGRFDALGNAALPASWLDGGFGSRPVTSPATDGSVPGSDLTATLIGSCAASCDQGPQRFVVQVSNHGDLAEPAGAALELWSLDTEDRLARAELGELGPASSVEVTLDLDPAQTAGGLVARVVSDHDCAPSDNQAAIEDEVCPE